MADDQKKSQNLPWQKVQQLVPANCDQSKRDHERSGFAKIELMAWLTWPYVTSRTGPADANRLHPEAPNKDRLLQALSLPKTNPKSALSPL